MYSANDVAAYVINWCRQRNIPITNLKLQKLLYFIQGEYVRATHERLIEEDFYAWTLGTVIPEVYYKYSVYSSFDLFEQSEENFKTIEEYEKKEIDKILEKYAVIPTWDLVELSKEEDHWKYNHQIFGDKALIPYRSIRSYYLTGELS